MEKRIRLINAALSQYGIKEIAGKQDEPEVLKYFDCIGFDGARLKDETSWCAAAINWCAKQADCAYTGDLSARSWLEVGEPVPIGKQQLGDVVVFWRGSHKDEYITGTKVKKGHVSMFIRQDGDTIYCLGGNQSNAFQISAYPASRVFGYRDITRV